MPKFTLNVNNTQHSVDVDADMPLLWVLRDYLNLKGAKFGCGIAQCGACTVHLNGNPIRSCSIAASTIGDGEIVTIEGLSEDGSHPVQQAWIEEDVPQCGYCQSGQIMTATALLDKVPNPTDEDINTHMSGIICRCGTYPRIKKAIKTAVMKGGKAS